MRKTKGGLLHTLQRGQKACTYIWGVSGVGKERVQVCMFALVFRVSVVEGKKSAQFCVRGIVHVRRGISLVNHLVCIGDIISAGVLVHGLGHVGVGGSNYSCYVH